MLRIIERGGHHDFPTKICLTIPKNFVGETCVSESFWYRKILWMRMGSREYHDFHLETFCLREPKNFVEEPFCVAENFWYQKMSRRERERGGHHDFPSKICCLTVPSNFVGETCVSENFWYRKMLRIRERGGASRLSVEILLSHSTEKLRRGNLCFRKFLVSKNVKDKRERRHHDFPSKLCCLTVPKNFVGETRLSENFWYRKMLRIRERVGHHDFPSTISRLTIPKNFVGETCVSESFWYRKILWMRRGVREYRDFQMEFFCLTEPKNFVEEPFCVAENFW